MTQIYQECDWFFFWMIYNINPIKTFDFPLNRRGNTLLCNFKLTHFSDFMLLLFVQIRKLRRELEASQEKVSTLTTQLSANVSTSECIEVYRKLLKLLRQLIYTLVVLWKCSDSLCGCSGGVSC